MKRIIIIDTFEDPPEEDEYEIVAQDILQQHDGDVEAAIKFVNFTMIHTPYIDAIQEPLRGALDCLSEWKTTAEMELRADRFVDDGSLKVVDDDGSDL